MPIEARSLATPALAPDPSSPGSAVLFGGWSQLGAQGGLWRYNQTTGWARLDAAVPAASRPLARFGAQLWVHAPSSAIYLFGGSPPVESADLTARNDLWRFDAAGSGSWDELKAGNGDRGIYDVARGTLYPGARRDYMLWQDRASSAVYLFGGNGLDYNSDIGLMNDLWRSRGPSYTEWEFVAGSQSRLAPTVVNGTTLPHVPGARCCGATAVDDTGTVGFLFGGFGSVYSGGPRYRLLNELWRIDLSTAAGADAAEGNGASSRWTFLGGDTAQQSAATSFESDPLSPLVGRWGRWPSARHSAALWFHASKHLYILGGQRDINLGYPCTGQKRSQELWKYNTTTTRFTLIGPVDADDNGGSTTGGPSTGADAAAAASSASGAQVVADDAGGAATEARDRAAAFVGSSGELVLIGGCGQTQIYDDVLEYHLAAPLPPVEPSVGSTLTFPHFVMGLALLLFLSLTSCYS